MDNNQTNHLPEEFIKAFNKSTLEIQKIENEQFIEDSLETEEVLRLRIEEDKRKTDISKQQFINELKSGLGVEIRKNPNKVTIIKRPWYYKTFKFIKKIFRVI
jgi:hypothetical protein